MDSLSQVVLGAAVGEAVLGKKIGNRAMMWGAFAGFLPDLDVTAGIVMDDIGALAVHRGITHSIFFAVFFSFILAWLVQGLYARGWYRKKSFKVTSVILTLGTIMITANFLPYMVTERFNFTLLLWTVLIGTGLYLLLNKFYIQRESSLVTTTTKDWYWLFFWGILTHPILDCFTVYGTQLFLPFSDYRVAFNVISVVDPLYTIPFLICVLVAASLSRSHRRRPIINWVGIGISSAYLLFCYYHKTQVNRIFEKSLAENNIRYDRYMTAPLILNNVLWMGLAETDSTFVHGYYSFMDEKSEVTRFREFPKQYDLVEKYRDDPTLKTLEWFSDGYYTILRRSKDDQLQLNDVRYGIFGMELESESDYIFKFLLLEKDGAIEMREVDERPEMDGEAFKELWDRIMGKT